MKGVVCERSVLGLWKGGGLGIKLVGVVSEANRP